MPVLNLAFAGFYGGAKSGFTFALAGVDAHRQRRLVQRAASAATTSATMKQALHRGGFETLNVYTTTAGGLPRLGVPAGPARLAPLPGRDRASTGSRCRDASTTLRGPVRPRLHARPRGRATGSTSSTRSSAAATRRATSSTTRRRCGSRRAAAPRARTRAPSRGSTRSTTTWTTRTTPVTTSSRAGQVAAHAGRLALLPGSVGDVQRRPRSGPSGICATGHLLPQMPGLRRLRPAPLHSSLPAPVAQGIERSPPERKVAGSIPAGRIYAAFLPRCARRAPGRRQNHARSS